MDGLNKETKIKQENVGMTHNDVNIFYCDVMHLIAAYKGRVNNESLETSRDRGLMNH